MKKRVPILTSATLLFALSSCDKISYIDQQGKNPIALNAMWEKVPEATTYKTRATEISNINITDFGVYAYYEANKFNQTTSIAQFMNNQKVEKVSGIWLYDPIMYWPPQGTISFFAYAPYAANESLVVSTKGMPTFDYSNPASISAQHDLLLSYPEIDKTYEDVSNEERLPLKFRHALSNIVFKAGVQLAVTDVVKIKSITIRSLKNRATAHFSKNSTIESDWNLNWIIDEDNATDDSYELTIDNRALKDINVNEVVDPVEITSSNGHLMVIPQNVDETAQITIVSTVSSEDKTTTLALNSLIAKFEPNKKYIISITVLSKVSTEITCQVRPWESKDINVPDFN